MDLKKKEDYHFDYIYFKQSKKCNSLKGKENIILYFRNHENLFLIVQKIN